MNKNNPVAIIVLGPPRSGTSAISNIISGLGVDFGDPANFLDTEVYNHNPIFFELKSLNDLNDDILGEFGSEYADGFLPTKEDFSGEILSKYSPIIKEMIDNEFGGSSVIGMKDPRFCFTLPVWQYALRCMGIELKVVYVRREVSAVIASNMSINKWPYIRNCSIWLQSVLSANYLLDGLEYVTANYDEIIIAPERNITILANKLELFDADIEGASKVINVDQIHFRDAKKTGFMYVDEIYKKQLNGQLNPNEYLHFREISLYGQSNCEHKISLSEEKLRQEKNRANYFENESSHLARIKDDHIASLDKRIIDFNNELAAKNACIDSLNKKIFDIQYELKDKEECINALSERDRAHGLESQSWRLLRELKSWKTILMLGVVHRTHLFDKNYYLSNNSDVRDAKVDPFMHYISHGVYEDRDPHALFDGSYYLENNPDVKSVDINPLEHYIRFGAVEGRNPHPLFDSSYYLENNPDVKAAGINPLEHYIQFGAVEGRNPHPLFDSSYYLEHNPDVRLGRINPLEHYIRFGAAEGRNPCRCFNSISYYEMHDELMKNGINPLVHFVLHSNELLDLERNKCSELLFDNGVVECDNSELAVVYLSRYGDNNHEQLLIDFVESYKRHKSGMKHDLIIVFKNYQNYADLIKAKESLRGVKYIGLRMPDESYDIGAYAFAAKVMNHKYMLFLNSYSQVQGDEWLAKMHNYVQLPDVGAVAATASFESLYNSIKLLLNVSRVVRPDARLHYYYYYSLPALFGHNATFQPVPKPESVTFKSVFDRFLHAEKYGEKYKIIIQQLYVALRNTVYHLKTDLRLAVWWLGHLKRAMSLRFHFPAFPNPHIRSTGFIMSRELFLEQVSSQTFNGKMDTSYFESGRKSMTNKLCKKDFKLLVVGRDGKGYKMNEWPYSSIFRQGDQKNLLISDNRTRESMDAGEGNKALLTKITWGDYLPDNGNDVPTRGVEFKRGKPVG